MFSIIAKILLIPVVKFIASRYLSRSMDKYIIFNLPNIFILLGLFIIIASQAALYAIFLIPGLPVVMAAAGLSMQPGGSERATAIIIDDHQRRAIEAFNRYQFEKQVEVHKFIDWDMLNSKVLVATVIITTLTLYGFLVNGGYIPPISILVKKALFGNGTEIAKIVQDKASIGESASKVIAEEIVNSAPKSGVSAFVEDRTVAMAKAFVSEPVTSTVKAIGTMSVLGFTVRNSDKIIAVTDVATRAAALYFNNTGYTKHIMKVAGYMLAMWSPFSYVLGAVGTVFAADVIVENEMQRVVKSIERNIDLIGLDYDEVIKRLNGTSGPSAMMIMMIIRKLYPDKDNKPSAPSPVDEVKPSAGRTISDKFIEKISSLRSGYHSSSSVERGVRMRRFLTFITIMGVALFVMGCIMEYEVQQLIVNLETIDKAREMIENNPPMVETGEVQGSRGTRDPFYKILVWAIRAYYGK